METVFKIPEMVNDTIKYFVDNEFVGNVNVYQVN